jgi:hypothetical protein
MLFLIVLLIRRIAVALIYKVENDINSKKDIGVAETSEK